MTTISFSVDEKTKKEIAKLAKERGRSQSDLFRELWEQFRWQAEWRALQRRSRPIALKLGIETDDDVERIFG